MKRVSFLNRPFLILGFLLAGLSGIAQEKAADDLSTIDGTITALYDVISGPAGERDWDRLRSLCTEHVRFNITGKRPDGKEVYMVNTLDDYIEKSGPLFLKKGFYETETGRTVEQFRGMAMVFSAYESRFEPDQEPFDKGINNIQLIRKDGQWLVAHIIWTKATEEHPIPEKYRK